MAARTRIIGTVLKHTLNRLTLRIARGSHGPFSIVKHVGRKSGRAYETPIIVQPASGGFMIELTYGAHVDWYRNVVAASGCVIAYKGRDYPVTGIEPVSTAVGIAAFAPYQRRLLTIIHRQHFVLFRSAAAPSPRRE